MKKILFVATVVKMHINVFHLPYIEWFKKQGYEVHVCARNDYEKESDCLIPFADKFINLPFERNPLHPRNVSVYRELKNLIKENEYDLIHCHTPTGGFLTRLAARNYRNEDRKVIYTAHGFHFYKGGPVKKWLIFYPIESYLSRYTDTLITINSEDHKISKRFHANNNYFVKGIGVDLSKFKKSTKIESIKQSLNLDLNRKILLSVGEVSKRKNHEVIIEALRNIDSRNLTYIIVGQGPLINKLKKKSTEYGLDVRFLGFRNDISDIMSVADLFVFPSLQEGLPVSLMEAMALELPVVCSNIRGNNDLIVEQKGGIMVEPNDHKAFGSAILRCLQNSEAKSFGVYNKTAVNDFSLEKVLDSMKIIYKSELGEKSKYEI